MSRSILDEAHIHPAIRETIARNHVDTVREVQAAIATHNVVVIGMAQNPFPKKACRALDAQRIAYKYLEYGTISTLGAAATRSKCGLGGQLFRWCSSTAYSWAERATWIG